MTIIVACKQNTNIFTTFLLINVLFIYTYWHFGSVKKPNSRTKKAPYIGICKFKVLLPGRDSNGFGSELGPSGAQEPNPGPAPQRRSNPAPPRGGILPEDSLLQSRALSEPAGECEDPAGEALFAAAQVISKKRSPDGSVLDRKHRGEERIRCPAVRRRPSAHRPFRVPARAWPALCPTARPPGRSCSRSSRSPGTSPYSQSAPAARLGIPA